MFCTLSPLLLPTGPTGRSFFLHPEGSAYLAAVFDPGVGEEALHKARGILSEFCQESLLALEQFLERAFQGEFPEVYIGAASTIFLEP